ncbi:MAG TPA: TIGR00730 family Rossman fold protein, partial [Candidatus Wallbacteria bacterium]|nr:TIGR00730 family Rossman fold protein [Candidatus Wallbacteria bacterium]
MKKICVFCGSSPGKSPEYVASANILGKILANSGLDLVYGGGNVGLMGEVANSTLKNGGKVIGVIPKALSDKELSHKGLTELHVVNTMHERKAMMSELSDAFIALPGGIGT